MGASLSVGGGGEYIGDDIGGGSGVGVVVVVVGVVLLLLFALLWAELVDEL